MRFFYVLQVDLTLGRVILYFKFKLFKTTKNSLNLKPELLWFVYLFAILLF